VRGHLDSTDGIGANSVAGGLGVEGELMAVGIVEADEATTRSTHHWGVADLQPVQMRAAPVESDVAALWSAGKQGHLADMTVLARSFAETGLLPTGLDVGWATTTLYVLLGPETWHLVRRELKQDAEAYHSWLLSQLRQAFQTGMADTPPATATSGHHRSIRSRQ
jgi:hypothetical protein